MTRIILASASPRRRALLNALGLDFEIAVSHAEDAEDFASPVDQGPAAIVKAHACVKRDDIVSRLDAPALVIAADTLVFLDEHVLGKPADAADARRMLSLLSGRTHQVYTGIAVTDTRVGRSAEGYECTDVTFRELSEAEIDRFVTAVNPVDRAGAYTVDGPGSLLVSGYDGCYQNVLGLPIVKLDTVLRELGYSLFEMVNPEKCRFL